MILPDEYKKALAFVKAKCPEAVLAGGCLRDLHTGKEVKDIDIFVKAKYGEDQFDFGGEDVTHQTQGEDYGDDDSEIYYIEELELPGIELPVQVIQLHPIRRIGGEFLKQVVERIDLGFCQVGFDGEQFYSTDLYVQDMKNKTITINPDNPEWNRDATLRRLDRLVGYGPGLGMKYADWRVIHNG